MQRHAWEARLRHAGAGHLIKGAGATSLQGPNIAWLSPDESRDIAAAALFKRNQIGTPDLDFSGPIARLIFRCNSAFALDVEVLPTVYTITMEIDGAADCSCSDFTHRGGACKHIRAALKRLDALRSQEKSIPHIPIPTSIDENHPHHPRCQVRHRRARQRPSRIGGARSPRDTFAGVHVNNSTVGRSTHDVP